MSRVVLPEIGNEYWSYFSLVMADDVLKRILETNSFYLGDTPAPKNACHNALRFFNLALKGGEDYYPIYSEETYGTFHIARNAIRKFCKPAPTTDKEVCTLLRTYRELIESIEKVGRPTPEHIKQVVTLEQIFRFIYSQGESEHAIAYFNGNRFNSSEY